MTDNSHRYCLIMAGGAGKRFWPVSRRERPKQFVPVRELGGITLLRHTYDRFSKVVPPENVMVITTNRYAPFVRDILPELKSENLIVEPYIRDTAPCLTYATYKLLLHDPQATVVVTPSDHIIHNLRSFVYTLRHAMNYASSHDELIVLGTEPTRPDTNFGYIQKARGSASQKPPFKVKTFTEKPDAQLAKVFVDSGEFLWNAGVFIWNIKTIREEIETCMPLLASQFEGWRKVFGTPREKKFVEKVYGGCERQSIAYGILERSRRVCVYPAHYGWDDIGEWQTYYERMTDRDAKDNAHRCALAIPRDCQGNLLVTTGADKIIAVQGLDSFMVIDTEDVLLICPRDAETYKKFVSFVNDSLPEKYK